MPFLGKNPTAGFASIVKDDLTPDGSTTAFTLSKQVANSNDIAVFVGNVRQEPTDAYSVSGTTLTMTAAPASGLNFYVLHIAGTVESSVIPADGTISTAKLQNDSVTGAKIENNAVNDAKIASGITSSKLTGALPAIDGSALTNLPAGGITHYSRWSRSDTYTAVSQGDNYFTNNWNSYGDTLGTNMSQSSGVFTFPETGYWLIRLLVVGYTNAGAVSVVRGDIETSSDGGSSFANRAYAPQGKTSARWYSAVQEFVIDVNNVSNWRARMKVYDAGGGAEVYFNSGFHTALIFMRLGDT